MPVPRCPKCFLSFHRGATACPHCGFSLKVASERFGEDKVKFRRVTDMAGALRHQSRIELAKALEKLERRIAPAVLAVYFPNIADPYVLVRHTFWMFNNMEIQSADFGEHRVIDPQWMLVLSIDVRSASACFVWGYQLDPYMDLDKDTSSIVRAQLLLRDGMLVDGIKKTMSVVTRQIAKRALQTYRNPAKYHVVFKPEEEITDSGKEEMES